MKAIILLLLLGVEFCQGGVAIADQVIEGDTGTWRSVWHGVGHANLKSSQLPRGCPLVVEALNAAEQGSFRGFCALFGINDTNAASNQLREIYEEWHTNSQRYVYLIGQEAFRDPSDGKDAQTEVAAVSIIPASMKRGAQTGGDPQQFHPHVIFAKREDDRWILLQTTQDKKIEMLLAQEAKKYTYKRADFTKVAIERNARAYQQSQIAELEKRGTPKAKIISAKEKLQALDVGITASDWSRWTNYYRVKLLQPQVVFGNMDECKIDFTSPLLACRSFIRATVLLDETTLLQYSDESGSSYLREGTLRVARMPASSRPPIVPTQVTLLLTAETTVDGRSYVMVLSREQNAQDPASGFIFLQSRVFVKDSKRGVYLYTRDMESSTLAEILAAAKAGEAGIGKYPVWFGRMKKSLFPDYFAQIE